MKIKGCHDFTGLSLEALSLIKALLIIGLYAAGVNVVGVAAFGNSAIAALVDEALSKTVLYGAPLRPADLKCGVLGKVLQALFPVARGFGNPHFKYGSPLCVLSSALSGRLHRQFGTLGGDSLGLSSATLTVFAMSAANIIESAFDVRGGAAARPAFDQLQESV